MVGRTEELSRLRAAALEAPQLIVMRGRRRVGKSYLMDHAYAESRFLYFQADEGPEEIHLQLLARECQQLTQAPVAFDDWNAALGYLGRLAAQEPLVVGLDEFQWMLQAQETLPSTITRHFDTWERRQIPITLVISGSALSLMENLLEGDRPMFGRARYRPIINPFDYREATEFGSPGASAEEKLRRYAVLGGTAQYQVWAGTRDLEAVLKERVLAKDESLFEEPLNLIRGESEIREPGNYYEILRAIAAGSTQFAEILQRTRSSATASLARRLSRLADLGYIEHRTTIAGNGTARYEVIDPFFRFWFRYVYPNRSRLQRGRVDEAYEEINRDLDNFMGPVFEQVCRGWAGTYASSGQFPAAQEIGAYWTRKHDVEVDVVAKTKRKYEALGSCKWSEHADTHDLDRLIECRDQIRGAGSAPLYIFARGFHPTLVEQANDGVVHLISADELF